ncbi:hypothetical protein EDB83DRAFT_1541646 [Lactarius deliciosus]|nr:hypothetical protein EDB83DRAFT_1541646 [Lactarius deliciosus]
MGFGAVFMFLSSAPPSKRSLGATNGLAQTVVSIQRTVGPTVAVSLAYSLQNNDQGGHFAYVVLLSLVGAALRVATQLPRDTCRWDTDTGTGLVSNTRSISGLFASGSCFGAWLVVLFFCDIMSRLAFADWTFAIGLRSNVFR